MNSIYKDFQSAPSEDFLTQFNKFSSEFTGDPEQRVKQLLQSGKMSKEQFDSYAQVANQLIRFIK
jgi:hypothetical protein